MIGVDCKIATVFNPDNPNEIGNDHYILGKDELEEIYGSIEDVLADEVGW